MITKDELLAISLDEKEITRLEENDYGTIEVVLDSRLEGP